MKRLLIGYVVCVGLLGATVALLYVTTSRATSVSVGYGLGVLSFFVGFIPPAAAFIYAWWRRKRVSLPLLAASLLQYVVLIIASILILLSSRDGDRLVANVILLMAITWSMPIASLLLLMRVSEPRTVVAL